MKNKLIIENEDLKEEYDVLIKVDTKDEEYLLYTKNEKNSCDDIICYAGKYSIINGFQKITPINDQKMIEYLDSILMQVQNKMNKKEGCD